MWNVSLAEQTDNSGSQLQGALYRYEKAPSQIKGLQKTHYFACRRKFAKNCYST